MRIAIVFPPQWDPRQPPRAPLVLEAAAVQSGAEARVFDFNFALYWNLLHDGPTAGTIGSALKQYLKGSILAKPREFDKVSQLLERFTNDAYSESTDHQLFWDGLRTKLSTDSSRDWQRVIAQPTLLPALRHLDRDIASLLTWNPDLIAISAISDTQLLVTLGLASLLRRRCPNVKLLLGGDAFAYRQRILSGFPWLLDLVDGIAVSDGEAVLKAIGNGVAFSDLPGVMTRAGLKPSELSPAFGDFVPTAAQAEAVKWSIGSQIVIPIETARGCPWGSCAFCIHPPRDATGHARYQSRSLPSIASELKAWCDHGFSRFFFIDEALPPQRLAEISRLAAGVGKPISWIGYARLDKAHTRENFAYARAAGLRKLFFGLETGSPRLLEKYKKGVLPETAGRVLRDAGAAGVAVHLFLMTGFPGETEDDRTATISLLDEILPRLDPFGFTYDLFGLKVERETALFADPSSFGARPITLDGSNDAAYQFDPGLSAEERAAATAFSYRIEATVQKHHGETLGLRHLRLSQDSLHLLLLEGTCPVG